MFEVFKAQIRKKERKEGKKGGRKEKLEGLLIQIKEEEINLKNEERKQK